MIMFVVVSVMVAFRIYQYPFAKFFILLLSGALAYFFVRSADPDKTLRAVFIGAIFTVIALLLDAAITNRFDGSVFSSVYLWASYVFIMIGAVAGGIVCGMTGKKKVRRRG